MAPALQAHRETLLSTIRGVRTRWRWKVVLRSLTVLLGAGVGTILVAAYGLEQFRFSPAAIVTARIVTYLVLAGLGWFFFVRPLARRVSDQQVALYLEEHEPSLHELLLSAVDAGSSVRDPEKTGESAAMLERLVESAIEKCQESDLGRGLERRSLWRSVAVMGGIAVAAAAIFTIGPAYLRQGALAVLVPVSGVEAASPYRIDVQPGNATVARGADVTVTAHLSGFTATEVDIFTRTGDGAPFERARDDRRRRRRRVRDDLLRPAPVARLFRPGGRRAVLRLQDRGGRAAVRRSAGTRVRVPGLHGPRAAADRGRRRHRGAARHDGAPPRPLHARHDERAHRARTSRTRRRSP